MQLSGDVATGPFDRSSDGWPYLRRIRSVRVNTDAFGCDGHESAVVGRDAAGGEEAAYALRDRLRAGVDPVTPVEHDHGAVAGQRTVSEELGHGTQAHALGRRTPRAAGQRVDPPASV